MNIYDEKWQEIEGLSRVQNEKMLNELLTEYKEIYLELKSLDGKDISAGALLGMVLVLFNEFDEEQKHNFKEKIKKINKSCLLKRFFRLINIFLRDGDTFTVELLLRTLEELEYIKKSKIENMGDTPFVFLKMYDDKNIMFTRTSLSNNTIDIYGGNCHSALENVLRSSNIEEWYGVIALEHNDLYGKHYHSFAVNKDIAYDIAQDIVIKYENYVNLFEPEILVYKSFSDILHDLDKLQSQKTFTDSDMAPVLKYGIYMQIKKSAQNKDV